MPFVAGIVFVLVLALVVPALQKGARTSQITARCRELQKRRDAMGQGGNPAVREALDAEIRACLDDARAHGVQIDPAIAYLDSARAAAEGIESEWRHYRNTNDTDAIARNNIMGTILRTADAMVANLRNAAAVAETPAARDEVRREVETQMRVWLEKAACWADSAHGCSRFGENEPRWDERIRDVMTTVLLPLGLRGAVERGWRSPRDRGDGPEGNVAWGPWGRAQPSGNFPPPALYRIGEIGRAVTGSWDDFGGGPHYAGWYEAIRDAWNASDGGIYASLAPALGAVPIERLIAAASGGAPGILFTGFRPGGT